MVKLAVTVPTTLALMSVCVPVNVLSWSAIVVMVVTVIASSAVTFIVSAPRNSASREIKVYTANDVSVGAAAAVSAIPVSDSVKLITSAVPAPKSTTAPKRSATPNEVTSSV